MKLPYSKQRKIYEAIHEEIMKARIAIRINKEITPDEIDEILSKIPDKAIDEILLV